MTERTHEVKCWPPYFEDIRSQRKTFELRLDDRQYKVGDILLLREWEPDDADGYTGAEIRRRIIYIQHGIGPGAIEPLKGLHMLYVILGLGGL